MKNNKGFTLIELLAVIVILAIIALIATPMIMGVIDSAKQSSAKSSAQYYVEAVEKSMMTSQLAGTAVADGTYTIAADGKTLSKSGASFVVNYKGATAAGTVTITGSKVTSATLTFSSIYAKSIKVEADGSATVSAS